MKIGLGSARGLATTRSSALVISVVDTLALLVRLKPESMRDVSIALMGRSGLRKPLIQELGELGYEDDNSSNKRSYRSNATVSSWLLLTVPPTPDNKFPVSKFDKRPACLTA